MKSDLETVPSVLTDSYEATCEVGPLLGPMPIDLPENQGQAVGIQAMSCTSAFGQHDRGAFVLLFLAAADHPHMDGLGFYHAMKPNCARAVAASLLRLADMADGGATKQ